MHPGGSQLWSSAAARLSPARRVVVAGCSLIGQRTVPIIMLIALKIIVIPILAAHVIPYFLDSQRLVVGVPLDQLRAAGLAAGQGGPGGTPGPGRVLFGRRGALDIPSMPT